MSPFKRLLRRIPPLRWCAYKFALQLRQKQLDASWAHAQSVLTTLGNISISWATIELMLSHLVIWHHVKNGVVPDEGLPRMLAKQLNYVKKSIEKDTSIGDVTRTKLADIRTRIFELNDFRISVIHGVVHQRNKRTTDWHTHSIKIDGLGWRVIRNDYSNGFIQKKSREISDLANEMSPFIASIIGMPHPGNSA